MSEEEIEFVSDDWQLEQYHKAGNWHITWALSADELLSASRLLRKHRYAFDYKKLRVGDDIPDEGKILSPELMLRGFAIECLLKALWVKRGGVICVDGKYTGVKGAGDHDLRQLAHVNGLRFTERQRDVLKRLSIYMTSVGRYPIAKDWRETKSQRMLGGRKMFPTMWTTPSDDETCDSIVKIIYEELER